MGRNDAESSRGGRSKSLSGTKTEATSENEDIQVTLDRRDKEQASRSKKVKEEAKGRLFIGGLSPRTTDDGLRNFLKLYGHITECFLVHSGGVSKCFGFASFEDPANAERLMRKSKELKLTLDGNTVRVSPASDRDNYSDHSDIDKKIFVGRLSWRTTEDGLLNYFRQYGTVVSSWILRDVESNKSRGFGFVVFEDKKDVDRVLAYEGHKLDGEKLRVKLAIPKREIGRGRTDRGRRSRDGEYSRRARSYSLRRRSRSRSPHQRSFSRSSRERSRSTRKRSRTRSPRPSSRSSLKRSRSRSLRKRSRSTHKRSSSRAPRQRLRAPDRSDIYESNKLFVRGLGSLQDKRKLEDTFREFGEVENVFVVNGADKRSRGFGFVTFASSSGASRALNSRSITIDGKVLTVSRAKVKMETTSTRSSRRHYSNSEPTKRRHREDHRNGSKHSHDYREHRDHSEQLRHGTSRKSDERRGYGPDHHRRTESQSRSHELGKDSRRHSRSSRHPQSSGGTRYRERATPEKHSTRSQRRREYDDNR